MTCEYSQGAAYPAGLELAVLMGKVPLIGYRSMFISDFHCIAAFSLILFLQNFIN